MIKYVNYWKNIQFLKRLGKLLGNDNGLKILQFVLDIYKYKRRSISGIAEALGIDRKTVRKFLIIMELLGMIEIDETVMKSKKWKKGKYDIIMKTPRFNENFELFITFNKPEDLTLGKQILEDLEVNPTKFNYKYHLKSKLGGIYGESPEDYGDPPELTLEELLDKQLKEEQKNES